MSILSSHTLFLSTLLKRQFSLTRYNKGVFTKIKNYTQGFTLMELLVVLAIIGLLSTTIVVRVNDARAHARDVQRIVLLINTSTALELYYDDNGRYPDKCTAGRYSYKGHSPTFGDCDNNYIENMANYITRLPIDPEGDDITGKGFVYDVFNDGQDYKLMTWKTVEHTVEVDDPFRRCPTTCSQTYCRASDPNARVSYAVYSNGAQCE